MLTTHPIKMLAMQVTKAIATAAAVELTLAAAYIAELTGMIYTMDMKAAVPPTTSVSGLELRAEMWNFVSSHALNEFELVKQITILSIKELKS